MPYDVWISLDEMVDFLLYAASLEASVATRSKISEKRVSTYCRRDILMQQMLTIDERVQDRHGTIRDTGIRMDLLEN
jgi:hypothetical protein